MISLHFSSYWLLLPLALLLGLFIAFASRNNTSGPAGAFFFAVLLVGAAFLWLLALCGMLLINVLSR